MTHNPTPGFVSVDVDLLKRLVADSRDLGLLRTVGWTPSEEEHVSLRERITLHKMMVKDRMGKPYTCGCHLGSNCSTSCLRYCNPEALIHRPLGDES